MAFIMNKLAMINSREIIIEKQNFFFAKNHCEIQVRTILVCALYSIFFLQHFFFLTSDRHGMRSPDPWIVSPGFYHRASIKFRLFSPPLGIVL
jgi:hypothetical protein